MFKKDLQGASVTVAGLAGQIKRLRVKDNDLLILRVSDEKPSRALLHQCRDTLSKALLKSQSKALGIVLPFEFDLEHQALNPEDLNAILMDDVHDLRRRLGAAVNENARLQETIDKLREERANDAKVIKDLNLKCVNHHREALELREELVSKTGLDVQVITDAELRRRFNIPCTFQACRYHTNTVNSNYCRDHDRLLREINTRNLAPIGRRGTR